MKLPPGRAFQPIAAVLAVFSTLTAGVAADAQEHDVRTRFGKAGPPIVVVAHRGCHNPAPLHHLPSVPENSLAALQHCVTLGVDMLEVDIRRSADGRLVIIHDETVDRTMTGKGRVSAMSLQRLRQLELLDNLGGRGAAPSGVRIATLVEMLTAARGRILLNLDVKDSIYAETIAEVEAAGMADQVVVKTSAGTSTPTLAMMAPYDRTAFAAILMNAGATTNLPAIAARQLAGGRAVAVELPVMAPDAVPALAAIARKAGARIWTNSLWGGFITGWGGDIDALRDPEGVWGRMFKAGVTVIQTDEPEALLAYRKRCCGA
jgi:glycerophosphoryl diester phosphodiesterase